MTESEWWASEKPGPMLEFLRGRASDRQLRLFACACCRSVWRFIPEGPCRNAVEVSRRHAEGRASAEELAHARAAAIAVADRVSGHARAAWAACESAHPSAFQAARASSWEAVEELLKPNPRAATAEMRAQAVFLRDIIGDPFHEVHIEPLRRLAGDPVVREIAEGVQAGAPAEDMAGLANRLKSLGCRDMVILDHCRSADPHVPGCWVIELLLSPQPDPASHPRPVRLATSRSARVQEVRTILAEHLGPKKYRRLLRKTIDSLNRPGPFKPPREWDEFPLRYRENELRGEELIAVFAICTVHGCELEHNTFRGLQDDPELLRDPRFLEARGTRFPHAHAEETDAEWERVLWWCPECQLARNEWMTARAGADQM